jgi:teichuronic acid biosynthesis glycosyltransferase TuaG
MSVKPLVSVVVPAYNASLFIKETIDSILSQSYQNFEIIVINDGSTDNTEGVVKTISDGRLQYYVKRNEGVSVARNYGLTLTKGTYIIFFDADDLMFPDFIEKRAEKLQSNSALGFCSGEVKTFPIENSNVVFGACDDIPEKILLYDITVSTCPSNYMYKKSSLLEYDLNFNGRLSSTADKYFLLQVAQVMKGDRVEGGYLQYRVNPNSMSNRITPNLLDDNELYYAFIEENKLIPNSIYKQVILKKNYILAVGNAKISRFSKTFSFGFRYFKSLIIL